MLIVELALIVLGWALVVVGVRNQLPHLAGIPLRRRTTRVPTNWAYLVTLIVGLSCCEVGAQLGRHGSLGSWGFLIAYVPVLTFVAITSIVHNRRLRSRSEGGRLQ